MFVSTKESHEALSPAIDPNLSNEKKGSRGLSHDGNNDGIGFFMKIILLGQRQGIKNVIVLMRSK